MRMGPIAHPLTKDANALQTLLTSFFVEIKSADAQGPALTSLATDFSIREGDLVTFKDSLENVHSGIAIYKSTPEGVRIWIRSKIGRSITADLPIDLMRFWYDFTMIEVWRRRAN